MINGILFSLAGIICICGGGIVSWIIYRRRVDDLSRALNAVTTEVEAHKKAAQDAHVEAMLLNERLVGVSERLTACAAIEQDNQRLRETVNHLTAEVAKAEEAISGAKAQISSLKQQIDALQCRQSETGRLITEKQAYIAKLETTIAADRQHAEEKIAQLMDAKAQLTQIFQSVAEEILEKKTKRVAETSQMQLAGILNPLREKLDEFQKKVDAAYRQESKDRIMLTQKVDMLADLNRKIGQDAENLAKALKGDNKTQGIWGEMILERLLALAGLVRGREYDVQVVGSTDERHRLRPDVVIHLPPENRHLVIDAKVSLTAFERYVNAEDESAREHALRQHIESLKNHIRTLAKKDYSSIHQLQSVDYVILFVAVEPAFVVAVDQAPDLYREAWEKNVLLVSPSTLLFVLRMVDLLWRQENQTHNAHAVLKAANDLYDKCCSFCETFQSIGVKIGALQDAYTDAEKKLATGRGNLLKRMETLRQMKMIQSKKTLPMFEEQSIAGGWPLKKDND